MRYFETLDIWAVNTAVRNAIEDYRTRAFLYDTILQVVTADQGKQLTKRIATKVQAALGEETYRVVYQNEHSYRLWIYPIVRNDSNREGWYFTLAYSYHTPVVSVERFNENTQGSEHMRKTADGLEALLNDDNLAGVVENWNTHISALSDIHDWGNSTGYPLGSLFNLHYR